MIPPREERVRMNSNTRNRGPLRSGFGRVDLSVPPPGYIVSTLVGLRSTGRQQDLPDMRNMTEFPSLGEPRYLTIRIN